MPPKHQTAGTQIIVVAVAHQIGPGNYAVPAQSLEQNISVSDLPSADPHVKGQLWSNGGAITISQG